MPTREDYRQLEIDDLAASKLVGPGRRAGPALKIVIALLVLAIVAVFVWQNRSRPQRTMLAPDADEFKTTSYQPPIINTPPPAINPGRLVIEAPPAPPPPAPPPDLGGRFPPQPQPAVLASAPPIAPPFDDGEARRLADEERRRAEEEERRRWERLRSPMMVTDSGGHVGVGPADPSQTGSLRGDDGDPNTRYLNTKSAEGVEISRATKNRRIDALIAQGTIIRGVLETAIQSDLPGMVRATTTENVWSFDGRRVIVPSGTRLIGEYKSGLATGQTRVFIVWTRILRSDGVSVQLGSPGTDDLGRTGLTGEVDKHYVERFGSAILLSVVGGGAQYLAGLGNQSGFANQSTSTSTTDPVTGLTTTTVTGPDQQSLYGRQIAAQNTSQTLTSIANEALKNSINIPPTIHVDQGAAIAIFVRRDLDFSSLYPDPVREMIRELQRGRGRSTAERDPSSDRAPREGASATRRLVTKP
ncbi:type IV secretion system protein VirB10 [uncultured Enterovirga sp.]|uniref:type IV secretion system protein VirB10 n=1 Tax=uncultured Enterovirga sp. TaxID=2026352 RepID=UPI0035CBE9F8